MVLAAEMINAVRRSAGDPKAEVENAGFGLA